MTCGRSLHKAALAGGIVSVILLGGVPGGAAGNDFPSSVIATHPVAYYRLDATSGKGRVGSTTYKPMGGVTVAAPGAPTGGAGKSVQLDGHNGYILTTQAGGVGVAASIMAWVNLAELPGSARRVFYVAGESQYGNDLDVQFEEDNVLKFYTAAGGHLSYTPPAGMLVNQWHMIVATLDTPSHTRVIYWDGKPVATDQGGGEVGKTGAFSIGESTIFHGRFLHGGVAEVALWDRALKATEVAGIFATAKPTASAGMTVGGASGSTGAGGGTAGPTTNAKVEAEDSKGAVTFKPQEQVAMMFLTAIEGIEFECWRDGTRVCLMNELLTGPVVKGEKLDHLKFDPKTDPNYNYILTSNETGWQLHANAKKPGLMGFLLDGHNFMVMTVTYNRSGVATTTDTPFTSRGISGDSFRVH
jgi:hypothetical protein